MLYQPRNILHIGSNLQPILITATINLLLMFFIQFFHQTNIASAKPKEKTISFANKK